MSSLFIMTCTVQSVSELSRDQLKIGFQLPQKCHLRVSKIRCTCSEWKVLFVFKGNQESVTQNALTVPKRRLFS